MSHVVALAFASGASLLVQLLAVILVILTRSRPKALLWAFWLTASIVNFGFGVIALAVFRTNASFLGSTSQKTSPAIYLIAGAVAVCVAIFAATRRGRELIGREVDKQHGKPAPDPQGSLSDRAQVKVQEVKVKAEEALKRGSVWVAIGVGVVLGAPTPYQIAGAGIMVRNGYGLLTQILLVALFSLITYFVVEILIISYAIWPEATSGKVTAFSKWLSSHKIQAAAAVAAVVGLILIGKGIAALRAASASADEAGGNRWRPARARSWSGANDLGQGSGRSDGELVDDPRAGLHVKELAAGRGRGVDGRRVGGSLAGRECANVVLYTAGPPCSAGCRAR